MKVPEHVAEAAEAILDLEWAVWAANEAEGSLLSVDPDNYLDLLRRAQTLARWVESVRDAKSA